MPPGKLITFKGRTQNITAWAKELKIDRRGLSARLTSMSLEDAMQGPNGRRMVRKRRYSQMLTLEDGRVMTVDSAAELFQVHRATVCRWVRLGLIPASREQAKRCSLCGSDVHVASACPERRGPGAQLLLHTEPDPRAPGKQPETQDGQLPPPLAGEDLL